MERTATALRIPLKFPSAVCSSNIEPRAAQLPADHWMVEPDEAFTPAKTRVGFYSLVLLTKTTKSFPFLSQKSQEEEPLLHSNIIIIIIIIFIITIINALLAVTVESDQRRMMEIVGHLTKMRFGDQKQSKAMDNKEVRSHDGISK